MKKQSMNLAFGIRFAIIVLCVVIMAGTMLFNAAKIQDNKEYVTQMNDAVNTLYASETGHLKWSSNLSAAIDYGTPFTGSLNEKECVLGKYIYSDKVQNDLSLKETVSKIEALHKDIHQLAGSALKIAPTDKVAANKIYKDEIQNDISSLLVLLDNAIQDRQTLAVQAENSLDSFVKLTGFAAIGLMLLTLIACFNMYVYIKNQIGKPILHIAKTAKQLAEGELNLDFSSKSTNEVGELGLLLNSSVQTIAEYVEDIDRAMSEFAAGNFNVVPSQPFIGNFKNIEISIGSFITNMSETLKTISQSSNQVSSGAEQISGGAQALAQGATEQASGVEELSATINELSSQVQQTAADFKEINDIMGITSGEVRDGSQKMEDMTSAMDDIIKFSQKISSIIKTIDDITFQTNILALNAAVEAARAGRAGKGFAVVADEVRSLAQKSAEAANDITALIENSIKVVNNGATLTEESAGVFKNIVSMSDKITTKVESAFIASENQALAIRQIVTGIEQISSVVQTNSATSEESAAASEELHSQAQLLKELVSKFTLFNV
ncbi:MAG: methyl-accepting chemotaxis protein [Oscillospiraceae bacterium]